MTRTARALSLAACAVLLLGGCTAAEELVRDTGLGSLLGDGGQPLYLSMTDGDVALANAALDRALERNASGKQASWRNRGSGNSGSVTPLRSYRASDGGYCRDYREVLVVGGDSETYTATACREPSGIWQPVAY